MKKKVCFIFIIFLIFSIELNAKNINMPFDKAKELANNYMETSSKHEYYLIKGNNLYFGYDENNKIVKNNNFLKGGLLNLQEYRISFFKNNSYLKTGVNYWTMTNDGDNYYVITTPKEKVYSIDKKHEARINEYVKKDTYVSGSGTYKDPWVFNKLNTIVFVTTDEKKGNVEPVKTYAFDGQPLSIAVRLTPGYEYASNSCNIASASNYGINLFEGVIKDDMYCEVSFKEKTYKVTYDNNGGSGCSNKQVTFNSTYGDLCTPVREGFRFLGWYYDINGDEEVTSATKVTQTDAHTLYAKWISNLTCSDLSSGIQCNTTNTNKTINYTGDCEYTCVEEDRNVWKIKFKTSGDLTLNSDISLDIFAVGGGGGSTGSRHSCDGGTYPTSSSGGGGGGYTQTYLKQDIKAGKYHIQVGNGGANGANGEASYFGSASTYFANGGNKGTLSKGGDGGSGGGGPTCPKCNGYDWGGCANYGCAADYGGKFGLNGNNWTTNLSCTSYAGKGQGGTTCEFGEGTTSECFNGGAVYSQGGDYYNRAPKKANSGNGANSGGSGSSGIVVIRNNLLRDIKINGNLIGTYTGTLKVIEEGSNWKIRFLSSGELVLNTSINVDLFLVGGGGGGGTSCSALGPGYYCQSGGGGGGGYTKSYFNKTINSGTYWIEVGAGGSLGGSGKMSYFESASKYFANGGGGASNTGGAGGSGGGSGSCAKCNGYDASGCVNFGSTSGTGGKLGTNGSGCSGLYGDMSGGAGQGSTTCEFGEGTTASCNSGVEAYAQGGMGASSKSNTGNGGNLGNVGNSGIVIFRNKR